MAATGGHAACPGGGARLAWSLSASRLYTCTPAARTTEPSRGRGDTGQPLSVGARARVGHGGAPDVRRARRVGGERPVDSAVGVGVGGVGRLSLRAGFDSARDRAAEARFREVLLEHLHHLPGFEVDDVDRAARADRDENLAVRGEEEEVRARDSVSRGALLLAKVQPSSSPPGVISKRRRRACR